MEKSDIVVMKEDNGRVVVIMDKSKYTGKGLTLLSTKQFKKLNLDPTKSTEVQCMVRKSKSELATQEYKRLYPGGSCQGKFYGMAKLREVDSKGLVDNLPIRPIISNINTLTCNFSGKVVGTLKRDSVQH